MSSGLRVGGIRASLNPVLSPQGYQSWPYGPASYFSGFRIFDANGAVRTFSSGYIYNDDILVMSIDGIPSQDGQGQFFRVYMDYAIKYRGYWRSGSGLIKLRQTHAGCSKSGFYFGGKHTTWWARAYVGGDEYNSIFRLYSDMLDHSSDTFTDASHPPNGGLNTRPSSYAPWGGTQVLPPVY
jgi:hypothetical protein